ncbi:MAG: IPT/TIG domain-containing protein, partial [Methanoregula sp.]|nr:IPT/TIG domain-containing protein [Methanoregula sp.]
MERSRYVIILGVILVLAVFVAGCSSGPASDTTTTVPTTSAPVIKYAAGDIIGKTSTSTDSVWLILAYDQTADQYERALIYKNTAGTWGYRTNTNTDKLTRETVEKLYPVKISHVTVSSVPIVTPTVPTTVPTTLSGSAPSVSNITPTSGAVGGTVSMTILGSNFQSGATAKLVQAGYPPVTATGVSVSSTSVTCTFSLGSLQKGLATVRVTNPDGQYGDIENVFSIGEAGPIIASVSPITGGLNQTYALTLTGQNFKDAVNVMLTNGGSLIPCNSPTVTGSATIKCNIATGSGPIGDWTVTVKNLDGQMSGVAPQPFKITNSTA